MRKIYYLLIIITVISGVMVGIYLYSSFKPKIIYLQSVYTNSSPKIDGYFDSTEWAPAFNINFTLELLGKIRQVELYIMNNNTHLFFAFKISNEDAPNGNTDEMWIWLDSNNNEELDSYEDIKILKTEDTCYIDAYHTSPPWMYIYPDSNYGGTTDGYAFWNFSNSNGVGILIFETVFPFISSDPHDVNVSRGTIVGITFEYHIFGTAWPGDNTKPNEWAKLVIA
ncbi:MAG: hypothetical protein ACTSYB_16280 [Candidatus Helarchaeota archaeon]